MSTRHDAKAVCYLGPLGSGKTYLGARWIVARACTYPRSIHLATNNTYPQCRDVVIPAIERALLADGIPFSFHKTDKVFTLWNGAQIWVRSTEVHNTLRGPEFGSWWGDEIRDADPVAVDVIAGRMRCKAVPRPRTLFTTTPNGYDHIYETFAGDKRQPGHFLVRGGRNPYVGEDYYRTLETRYDPLLARQELDGEFVITGVGAAFRTFDRKIHVRSDLEHDPHSIAYLGVDFGARQYTAIVMQANPWRILDERRSESGTIDGLIEKLKDPWAGHEGGWSVEPDPAGQARGQTGRTDHDLLLEALAVHGFRGVAMYPMRKAPGIRDKVNTVNALFLNARKQTNLWVRHNCRGIIRDLEQVKWDKDGRKLEKGAEGDLTHHADAASYPLYAHAAPNSFERQRYLGNGRWVAAA